MVSIIHQKVVFSMLVMCAMIFSGYVTAVCAEDPPEPAKQAAEAGLALFLKAIPVQYLGYFNFSNPQELEQAILGTPFRMYTIAPQDILNYQAGTPVSQILVPRTVWFFPVVVNGESRTLLEVQLMKGVWQAVGIGNSGTAKLWAIAQKAWHTVEGYESVFVRVFQAQADFVVLTHQGDIKMIPLESVQKALDLAQEGAYNPAEIIVGLQQSVQKNLESSPFKK